jgi:hypothetical protein
MKAEKARKKVREKTEAIGLTALNFTIQPLGHSGLIRMTRSDTHCQIPNNWKPYSMEKELTKCQRRKR